MEKNEIQVGASYIAKVSGKLAEVRITGESRHGGWDAVNVATKKAIRVKSAQRLRAAAGKPKAKADAPKPEAPATPAGDNPLVKAEASAFTELLGKATMEQLNEALAVKTLSAKKRSRIEAVLKTRTTPRPADDVAKTVAAVQKGNLAEGVEVPMPARRRAAKGRGGAAPAASGRAGSTKDASTPTGRAVGQRGGPGAKKATSGGLPSRMSGLDAAAKVLAENGKPMSAGAIVEQMLAKGYWTTGGATPAQTLYSAMLREAKVKGSASRFAKVDRGLWTLTDAGKASFATVGGHAK